MTRDETTGASRWVPLGQEEVLLRLSRARAGDRLAHSYLFLGPRGCGKTRLALAFAQELLCPGGEPPCGACRACARVSHLTHPDLHLVFPLSREEAQDPEAAGRRLEAYARDRYHLLSAASGASIGIDRIRALKEEVAKARIEGERRVVIVSGADRMTEQAAQAALKLVEEPPPGTILILEAEERTDLLPTLVSRCQSVRLRSLPRDVVAGMLEREREVPPREARVLAALAQGSLGRAIELRESDVVRWRDAVLELFRFEGAAAVPAGEIERRVRRIERAWTAGSARQAVDVLLLWHRDLLAAHSGLSDAELVNADLSARARVEGAGLAAGEIRRRVRLIEELGAAVEQNVNPVLALHAALARMAGGPVEEDRPVPW